MLDPRSAEVEKPRPQLKDLLSVNFDLLYDLSRKPAVTCVSFFFFLKARLNVSNFPAECVGVLQIKCYSMCRNL